MATLTNVSNLAAFGVEWIKNGVEHQIVNVRGTTSLTLEVRTQHSSPRWVHIPVSSPERFGLTTPPKTFAAFKKIVEAFLAEAGEEG